MKKSLFIVITIFLVAAVLKLTPLINGGLSSPSNDGYWRDCRGILDKGIGGGCYFVTSVLPDLTTEEKAFKAKLDSLSPPPARVTKADIVKLLGREPDQVIDLKDGSGRYQWNNFGPGHDTRRGVVVHLYHEHLSGILWTQPKRFFLNLGFH